MMVIVVPSSVGAANEFAVLFFDVIQFVPQHDAHVHHRHDVQLRTEHLNAPRNFRVETEHHERVVRLGSEFCGQRNFVLGFCLDDFVI